MLNSSITRRYTPPTCTLAITAQASPLSQWLGRPVVKALQFQLSLEDLAGQTEPIDLWGDRQQLEALTTAVERYIQQLIRQAPDRLSLQGVNRVLPDPIPTAPPEELAAASSVALALMNEPELPQIYLQPRSLVQHELVLGSLATEASGAVITLSVTQLFDLAIALEESAAEIDLLPALGPSPLLNFSATPIWLRSAALVVAVLGVTTVILKLSNIPGVNESTSIITQRAPDAAAPSASVTPPPPPPGSIVPPPSKDLPTVSIPSPLPAEPVPSVPSGTGPKQSQPQPSAPVVSIPTPEAPRQKAAPKQQQQAKRQVAPQAAAPPENSNLADSAPANSEATAARADRKTAFDTIPQVAEVRRYFSDRWQPPAELTQTLEYTLILNADGSIQRVIPLGKAAAVYLDRTPMPLANEPFVSPVTGTTAKIRLVLEPGGGVQAFLQ